MRPDEMDRLGEESHLLLRRTAVEQAGSKNRRIAKWVACRRKAMSCSSHSLTLSPCLPSYESTRKQSSFRLMPNAFRFLSLAASGEEYFRCNVGFHKGPANTQ